MTWLVKCTEDSGFPDSYVTEHANGTTYFHEKQIHAKRFKSVGKAYRVAMAVGDCKVVRLKTSDAPPGKGKVQP